MMRKARLHRLILRPEFYSEDNIDHNIQFTLKIYFKLYSNNPHKRHIINANLNLSPFIDLVMFIFRILYDFFIKQLLFFLVLSECNF